MPLERKILLSILITIILIFIGYFTYNTYYVTYLNNKNSIKKYKKLISGYKDQDLIINQGSLDQLQNSIIKAKDGFFTTDESSITKVTPFVKNLLLTSGINIIQYQNSDKSVRFTISGKKNDLIKFLYSITKENKYYDFPLFNIRMINNYEFSGFFEISRLNFNPVNTNNPELEIMDSDISEVKLFNRVTEPFNINSLYFLGTTFLDPITPQPIKIEEETNNKNKVEIIPNIKTDKFSFVGTLKQGDKIITMFKESNNSRVYKFNIGSSVSGWTYLGLENNKYLFKYKERIYEVTE